MLIEANEKMAALFQELSKEFAGIGDCKCDEHRMVFLCGDHYYALTTRQEEEAEMRSFLEVVSTNVELHERDGRLLFECQLTGNYSCEELLNAFTVV